jgi:uncharacterized protein YqcC (DUF446 family)
MKLTAATSEKIGEIRTELKKTGLWKNDLPGWVMEYEEKPIQTRQDFLEWLQFIYLPNCANSATTIKKALIVPQAIKFFEKDVNKGNLLQLLIELDSLL